MSTWLQWILLTSITGSPVLSAVVLLVGWWVVDRFTVRALPSPFRVLARWSRRRELERQLLGNPHDRRARLALAELALERGKPVKAVEVLRPNLEAGDDDVPTLFVMGAACLGAGHTEQGELLLTEAQTQDPKYRLGEIELIRGRERLKRGDAKGAVTALERFVDTRKGTVEGRVRLAQALEKGGDDERGALLRREAWTEYLAAPGFQRSQERLWAWRANPSRPALYAAIGVAGLLLFARFGAPAISRSMEAMAPQEYEQTEDDE